MPDFWRHSGYHLTTHDNDRRLLPGDDLLRAYFARPEVAPIEESCASERALFARLLENPRQVVNAADLEAIVDPDARGNYAVVMRFRDHLLASHSLEVAYRALFADRQGEPADFARFGFPPMFADQLAQMILRGLLDEQTSSLHVRAAELFFREQYVHADEGQVLVADRETVDTRASTNSNASTFGNLGRLLAQAQTPIRRMELEVLDDRNADVYWTRDERHDMALQVNFGSAGLGALCDVVALWVRHFFSVQVRIVPVRSLESARMHWYVGLDGAATALMNDIYNGRTPDEEQRRRIICMMRLECNDASGGAPVAQRSPVYLAMAMDEKGTLRMKPQNLLTNLPFGLRV